MAVITINVPANRATEYLEEMITQINNGMTSGHWDAETNWKVSDWENEKTEDLA